MKKGFTLIELLIVVAIIAILAAIAVPNFLEAQTRSKVARVKADMRTLEIAGAAYFVDFNKGPLITLTSGLMTDRGSVHRLVTLSTPVAYMSSSNIQDPFMPPTAEEEWVIPGEAGTSTKSLSYVNVAAKRKKDNQPIVSVTQFVFVSYGPDTKRGPMPDEASLGGAVGLGMYAGYAQPPEAQNYFDRALYDPTNGTVSGGDIFRYEGRSLKK